MRKVVQVLDRFVQLAVIESAPSPSFFEFLEFLGSLLEVLPFMVIETAVIGGCIKIRQNPVYERIAVAVTSLAGIAVIVIALRVIPILSRTLRLRAQAQNQEARST